MRCLLRAVLAFGLVVTFMLAGTENVRAQGERSPVKIRRLKTSRVAPNGGGNGRWLEVRVEYATAPQWLDQLDVTFYVLLASNDPDEGFKLFTGEVSNVNIKRDSNHRGAMWMHPDTVERYGALKSVAVVMKVDGRPVGMSSDPSTEERWWERYTPTKGMLYNHYELPTRDDDKYPAIAVYKGR